LTGIPGPITESLRYEFSKEIVALFRRANVSPALIYTFSKTGLVATEEDRGREDCPRDFARESPASKGEAEWEMTPAFEHLQFAIEFCNAAQVPEDVMEAMFFRFWLRTLVLNDRLPELFFQTLDRNWELVHAQVQSRMARYAGPRLQ
jgi:hypothetical protein